jgi:hypothetical protein
MSGPGWLERNLVVACEALVQLPHGRADGRYAPHEIFAINLPWPVAPTFGATQHVAVSCSESADGGDQTATNRGGGDEKRRASSGSAQENKVNGDQALRTDGASTAWAHIAAELAQVACDASVDYIPEEFVLVCAGMLLRDAVEPLPPHIAANLYRAFSALEAIAATPAPQSEGILPDPTTVLKPTTVVAPAKPLSVVTPAKPLSDPAGLESSRAQDIDMVALTNRTEAGPAPLAKETESVGESVGERADTGVAVPVVRRLSRRWPMDGRLAHQLVRTAPQEASVSHNTNRSGDWTVPPMVDAPIALPLPSASAPGGGLRPGTNDGLGESGARNGGNGGRWWAACERVLALALRSHMGVSNLAEVRATLDAELGRSELACILWLRQTPTPTVATSRQDLFRALALDFQCALTPTTCLAAALATAVHLHGCNTRKNPTHGMPMPQGMPMPHGNPVPHGTPMPHGVPDGMPMPMPMADMGGDLSLPGANGGKSSVGADLAFLLAMPVLFPSDHITYRSLVARTVLVAGHEGPEYWTQGFFADMQHRAEWRVDPIIHEHVQARAANLTATASHILSLFENHDPALLLPSHQPHSQQPNTDLTCAPSAQPLSNSGPSMDGQNRQAAIGAKMPAQLVVAPIVTPVQMTIVGRAQAPLVVATGSGKLQMHAPPKGSVQFAPAASTVQSKALQTDNASTAASKDGGKTPGANKAPVLAAAAAVNTASKDGGKKPGANKAPVVAAAAAAAAAQTVNAVSKDGGKPAGAKKVPVVGAAAAAAQVLAAAPSGAKVANQGKGKRKRKLTAAERRAAIEALAAEARTRKQRHAADSTSGTSDSECEASSSASASEDEPAAGATPDTPATDECNSDNEKDATVKPSKRAKTNHHPPAKALTTRTAGPTPAPQKMATPPANSTLRIVAAAQVSSAAAKVAPPNVSTAAQVMSVPNKQPLKHIIPNAATPRSTHILNVPHATHLAAGTDAPLPADVEMSLIMPAPLQSSVPPPLARHSAPEFTTSVSAEAAQGPMPAAGLPRASTELVMFPPGINIAAASMPANRAVESAALAHPIAADGIGLMATSLAPTKANVATSGTRSDRLVLHVPEQASTGPPVPRTSVPAGAPLSMPPVSAGAPMSRPTTAVLTGAGSNAIATAGAPISRLAIAALSGAGSNAIARPGSSVTVLNNCDEFGRIYACPRAQEGQSSTLPRPTSLSGSSGSASASASGRGVVMTTGKVWRQRSMVEAELNREPGWKIVAPLPGGSSPIDETGSGAYSVGDCLALHLGMMTGDDGGGSDVLERVLDENGRVHEALRSRVDSAYAAMVGSGEILGHRDILAHPDLRACFTQMWHHIVLRGCNSLTPAMISYACHTLAYCIDSRDPSDLADYATLSVAIELLANPARVAPPELTARCPCYDPATRVVPCACPPLGIDPAEETPMAAACACLVAGLPATTEHSLWSCHHAGHSLAAVHPLPAFTPIESAGFGPRLLHWITGSQLLRPVQPVQRSGAVTGTNSSAQAALLLGSDENTRVYSGDRYAVDRVQPLSGGRRRWRELATLARTLLAFYLREALAAAETERLPVPKSTQKPKPVAVKSLPKFAVKPAKQPPPAQSIAPSAKKTAAAMMAKGGAIEKDQKEHEKLRRERLTVTEALRLTLPAETHNDTLAGVMRTLGAVGLALREGAEGFTYQRGKYESKPNVGALYGLTERLARTLPGQVMSGLARLMGSDKNKAHVSTWFVSMGHLAATDATMPAAERADLCEFGAFMGAAIDNLKPARYDNEYAACVPADIVAPASADLSVYTVYQTPQTCRQPTRRVAVVSEEDRVRRDTLVAHAADIHRWRVRLDAIERAANAHNLLPPDYNLRPIAASLPL